MPADVSGQTINSGLRYGSLSRVSARMYPTRGVFPACGVSHLGSVLPTERIAYLCEGRRLLRCGMSIRPMSGWSADLRVGATRGLSGTSTAAQPDSEQFRSSPRTLRTFWRMIPYAAQEWEGFSNLGRVPTGRANLSTLGCQTQGLEPC
jgi:hypothetical protein